MSLLTAQEFQEKHARRLKAATADIQLGISKVTESPTAKAAQKQEKMLNNLTEAVRSGKWAAGLNRVTLQQWKDAASKVGVGRIAAGIDASKDKVIAFANDLLPYIANQQSKLASMPDVTLEDSINRMTSFIRGMAGFKRTT
jgi:hypothetical protein